MKIGPSTIVIYRKIPVDLLGDVQYGIRHFIIIVKVLADMALRILVIR